MQHYIDDTTTRNTDQDKAWPPNTPEAQEAEGNIQQLTPIPENNVQGIGEQMQISNKVTQSCSHNIRIHQPQTTNSLRDTVNSTTHTWS